MNYTFAQYRESADALQAKLGGFRPKVAMILGSGLGSLGDQVEQPLVVPYAQVPHMKRSTAPDHKGRVGHGIAVFNRPEHVHVIASVPEGNHLVQSNAVMAAEESHAPGLAHPSIHHFQVYRR